MSATPYRRPAAVAASSITVLAPTTAASATAAVRASRQVPGRGRIASASSSSSSCTAATSHRVHEPGSRSRSIRDRRNPRSTAYGTSTTAARPSPAAGGTTAATVSTHTAATQTPGTPPSSTTRR